LSADAIVDFLRGEGVESGTKLSSPRL
jgi:hypothetical protein